MRKKRESQIDLPFLLAALERAVAEAPEKRDFYDRRVQGVTQTKGKPIYDIQRGKNKNPALETIQLIADAFERPIDFFLAPTGNAIPIPMEGASRERMREDLPIYGTALGAPRIIDGEAVEQTTLNQGDVVTYAKRPVILNGRTDAYGLYVVGSSMYPVHPEGSTILVEKNRPPRIGDDVVVYLRPNGDEDDGERARAVLIKRLVRRTAQYVELEQFTPAITFRIDMAEVLRVDRVMTLGDLLS